jgi:predicted MFS family arabinose efflux permease
MPRLLLLMLPGPSVALVLVIVGVVVVLGSRIPSVVAALHARRSVTIGRVALALVALVTLPGFASDLVDILGRP